MTYEQFLHASPEEFRAYKLKHKLDVEAENQKLWLQGAYIHNAFGAVMQNAFSKKGAYKEKYIEKPLDLFEKTEEEKQAERKKEQEKITAFFEQHRKNWIAQHGDKNKHT